MTFMGDGQCRVATGADGEQMSIDRQQGRARRAYPWWRPLAFSTAAAAAVAALFNPLPAAAAPQIPAPAVPAVPDPGSRPSPLGTLVMPGQKTPTPVTTTVATPGVAMSPLLQKIEKQRAEIAALGDRLIRLGEDRDLAKQQLDVATKKVTDAGLALVRAQEEAAAAAAAALRDQAALPPGTLGSGLADLDALSRMQRGESASEEAATRQLAIVQAAQTAALAEQTAAATTTADLTRQYDQLNATIAKKQAALQKDENRHADEITAAEAALSAEDRRLGAGYLGGTAQGRGADPRAVAALTFALAQRGDPYVWSEEGPDQYDCSGLMFAAYRSAAAGRFPLMRVSRDQYWQTRNKVVDRYSLLPGDLLFFSSTSSWTGIHHVAMYAGDGMMVEAPRSGLNVRLVPVRWSRLFQATRIYGSVDGPTRTPDLTDPPPSNGGGTPTTKPTPKPSASSSKPPTKPSATPTSPSASPSKPSPSPSVTPSATGTPGSPSPSASSSSAAPANSGSDPVSPTASTSQTPSAAASASKSASAPAPASEPTSPAATPSKTTASATGSASAPASPGSN
jgi:cell wall-associated NlpC family hydrolase